MITQSLPVCLDQILHFDVYKINSRQYFVIRTIQRRVFENDSRNQELVKPMRHLIHSDFGLNVMLERC